MKRILDLKFGATLLMAFMVMMFLALPAQAQLTRGTISGTVRDPQGATVAGAQVMVTNPATNVSREATTNDEGYFSVPALDPGVYTVSVTKTGFSKVENREVTVQATQTTTFDPQLAVGDVSGVVDVTAETEAVTLNKTNATVGLAVNERRVEELPLSAARNINNLALLSPNVVLVTGATGISANGQRGRNNNFTIDGSDNNDITITVSTTPVIPEAVAEFQIQTNPYSAEYGRNSGANINVITKSGTNKFHGDFFEFYQGSGLNARDNVEKRNGLNVPARYNRNQFGFTIGGPLLIPRFGEGGDKAYNGKNRTYFFFAFQNDYTRSAGALQASVIIPTQAGFAALATVPLRPAAGAVPAQTAASRNAVLANLGFLGTVYAQSPVFSNITTQTINGVPIQVGTTNLGVSQPDDTQYYIARVDHRFTDDDNFTIRYIQNKAKDPNVISNLTFGQRFAGAQLLFDINMGLSETHVFNSNVVNEARASYIRRNLAFPENDPISSTTTISGAFTIGGLSNFPQGRVTNYIQFSDTLSWQYGRHALKFGVDFRHNELFNTSGFDTKGSFTFNNLADYLNNNAFLFRFALSPGNFRARQIQQFYFVQDDFRMTPNLTLNFGLRYETAGAPLGFFGDPDPAHQAFMIPAPTKRDNNNFAPSFGFAYSPRPAEGTFMRRLLGDGKTVFRGGFRISYDLLFYNLLTVNVGNFPFTVTSDVNNVVDQYPAFGPTITPAFNPLNGFVNTAADAPTPYSQLYSFSIQREMGRDYVLEVGYTGSRSLNQIRQLVPNQAILTPAQIALARASGAAAVPSVQSRRVLPTAGARTLVTPGAQATYNAGYASLNKRFSRGLQFGISYTFARNLSNNDESLGVATITASSPQVPQDTFNIDSEKGLSAFHRKHRFVANFLYDVPTPGFASNNGVLRQVFGGWQISGIHSRQSGQPFTVYSTVDTNGNGTANNDRPNFNPAATITIDPACGCWRTFSQDPNNPAFIVPRNPPAAVPPATSAATSPAIFTGTGAIRANALGNGNLGRNTFVGPGFANWNLSLAKNFRWGESYRLSIRADFLNAFNQDSYGNPTSNMNSANFGLNTNNWGSRTIVLGGKFSF
jgi:outer membrane receptor protein involved in Fe transport